MRRIKNLAILCLAVAPLLVATMPELVSACDRCRRRCHVCCCCCNGGGGQNRDGGSRDDDRAQRDAPVAAPLVQSMPMFTMPMMFASMPVMPAMATTAAPARSSAADADRMDELEMQMTRLAKSVRQMQGIMDDHSEILKAISKAQGKNVD